MKQIIIAIIAIALAIPASAQQEPHYTQGQFNNNLVLNPADAGVANCTRAGLRYRNQWSGFTGAPKNLNLIVDGRVKERLGLGLVLQQDQLGIERATSFDLNLAYHIKLDDEDTKNLSIGLKGGMSFIKADFSKLRNVMLGDPLYVPTTYNKMQTTYIGIGGMYYDNNFYLGLASPRLVSSEKTAGKTKLIAPHFYAYTGYKFDIDESNLSVIPSVLLKYQSKAPLEADLAVNLWYKGQLGTGISYRTGDALNLMLQYRHKGFIIGYGHDITTSGLRSQTFGSSEIFAGYKFCNLSKSSPTDAKDPSVRDFF